MKARARAVAWVPGARRWESRWRDAACHWVASTLPQAMHADAQSRLDNDEHFALQNAPVPA